MHFFNRKSRALSLNFCIVTIGGLISASFAVPTFYSSILNTIIGFDHLSSYNQPLSITEEPIVAFYWSIGSVITLLVTMQRDKTFRMSNIVKSLRGTETMNGEPGGVSGPHRSSAKKVSTDLRRPAPMPAEPDVYNMYDPGDLPLRLAEYANMVYAACEDLGNFFGFQDASVRNQAEHLLILLSNNRRYMTQPAVVQPPSPIHALHSKVFSNYRKWCKSVGVRPNFSKMNAMSAFGPPAVVSRVVDLVLYFCCWGEAANIRHMPECLWFLYHKMMEEYTKSDASTHNRSLYAGHYLDKVVTPIYEIVMKVSNNKVKLWPKVKT